jgi:SAM-dependent methyltransferase
VGLDRRWNNEITHGKLLASGDTEVIWGWGTPAGRLRAEQRAERIASGAELRSGARVLEIGCGTGLFTEMFARTGAQIVAVDISRDLLQKARARNLPPSQVQFLEKRFEDCDVDGPFDSVIGSSVLHHLDIHAALGNIFDLLKPGGRLCFGEPNMLNPQVFLERRLSFIRPLFWYVSPDETAFIRWSLASLLARVGFHNITIKPLDWLHPSVPPALIGMWHQVGSWFERIPVLKEFAGSLYIQATRPK